MDTCTPKMQQNWILLHHEYHSNKKNLLRGRVKETEIVFELYKSAPEQSSSCTRAKPWILDSASTMGDQKNFVSNIRRIWLSRI